MHLPNRVGELFIVKLVHMGHGKRIGRVRVHNYPVFGVLFKPCDMAHKVRGQLACESAAVLIAPKQLGGGAVFRYAYDSEVCFGVFGNIFKVFARARHYKYLTLKLCRVKAGGNSADDLIQVKVLPYRFRVQHIAYVAAVSFVPALAVHVGGHLFHFFNKRCS